MTLIKKEKNVKLVPKNHVCVEKGSYEFKNDENNFFKFVGPLDYFLGPFLGSKYPQNDSYKEKT